jgi:hypothetical protein
VDELMGIYFNEDWFEDYGRDEHAAVRDFVSGDATDIVQDTLSELRRMMAQLSPVEFEHELALLLPAYTPRGGQLPYREFADRVAAWIAESLDEPVDQ